MEDETGFRSEKDMKQFEQEKELNNESEIGDLGLLDRCKMLFCQKSKLCLRL